MSGANPAEPRGPEGVEPPAIAAQPDVAGNLPGSPQPKVDPESLVLRGTPRRVVRFRRELIIGIAAVGSLAIAATAWIALRPASFRLAASGEEMFERKGAGSPDALAAAPGRYDEIPKLGPPLPGDLGRPILEHQRQLERAEGLPPVDPAADPAASARERAQAQEAAARQSAILMSLGGRGGAAETPGGAILSGGARPPHAVPADMVVDGDSEARLAAEAEEVNPHRLQPPASQWIVTAGSTVSAHLVTGLNSDLPGVVIAQVSEPVYDSITGKTLLIPQGARLLGRYESNIAYGQRRALVVWHRIIWPDGTSLRIDEMPASDAGGAVGIADRVDFHGGALIKGVVLSSVLGVGTELGFGGSESELVRALRESAQTSGARAGDRIVERSLDIKPTIKIRPGWPVRVLITKDLILKPWRP